MRKLLRLAIAFSLLVPFVAADVIYLHCPTLFTKSVSTITANYFKGNPPVPSCVGLNITVDPPGYPPTPNALTTTCVSNGLMTFNISTPSSKTYNITGYSNPAYPGTDGTTVSCLVQRKSFNVSITVPEFSWLLLPLFAAGALFLLRKSRKKRKKG